MRDAIPVGWVVPPAGEPQAWKPEWLRPSGTSGHAHDHDRYRLGGSGLYACWLFVRSRIATISTYDPPVATAELLGIVPHDGDLLHAVFLYHLHLNGIGVVRRLEG